MTTSTTSTIPGPQGDLALTTDDGGAGTPVLLVHADGGSSRQWSRVVERLVPGRAVAALDLRGHGDSASPANDDLSYPGRGEDIAAVLDHLGWSRYWLLSHSGGGPCALAFSATGPEGLLGIVMADPTTDPAALPRELRKEFVFCMAGPGSLDYLKGYYRTIAGDDEEVVAQVMADADRTDAVTRAGLGTALASWDPRADLDACPVPLYVVGADGTAGPAAVYSLRPQIPHEVVHGTGHWVTIERPDEVVAAFERFVAETEGAQALL